MRINFAHYKQNTTTGRLINFAVFDARSATGSNNDNASLLSDLTYKASMSGLKIDCSALAYNKGGQLMLQGDKNVVELLSTSGLPRWTHKISI
jgi:hypothetical protein